MRLVAALNECARQIVCVTMLSTACVANSAKADDWWHGPQVRAPLDVPTLATSGASGGLVLPDGRVLPQGTLVFGFNNALEPGFSAAKAENFQFGIGLLPFIELTGRLANYPIDQDRTIGRRDLSVNLKATLPKLFRFQPDIGFGLNDLGGGAPMFQSKYLVVSEDFGPLRLRGGTASGEQYLNGHFAGGELLLGRSGASVSLERNSQASYAGMRYMSRPFEFLGKSRIVVSAQRPFHLRTGGSAKAAISSVSINLVFAIGNGQGHDRRFESELEPIWTQPLGYVNTAPMVLPVATQQPVVTDHGGSWGAANNASGAMSSRSSIDSSGMVSLRDIQSKLVSAGLERIRVGIDRDTLVVEFENHRYNQNEVDAIGIVLGVAVLAAPEGVRTVAAIAKKANLPLYKVSVDKMAYRAFASSGDVGDLNSLLTFQYRPTYSETTQWISDAASQHGFSRFRIVPSLLKFVGTDVGVLDYSLAADIQGFVPLWKGAELATSFFSSLAESKNVSHGIYGFAQQRSGLKSAVVSQSFWLTDRLLNVASIGKFMYDDIGIQVESVYFVPNRDDQFRLKYTHLRYSKEYPGFSGAAGGGYTPVDFQTAGATRAGAVSYLWNYHPLNISIDASYNKYIGKDQGPTIQLNRWFGDVQAQVFMRRSNLETKVGFGLAFPLTPRQGMKPGLTHVEGSSNFPLRLETRFASEGQCNCITNGIVQEMPMVYSSSTNLLNQGRIGREYLLSQLQRMREAAFIYANLAL